MDLIIELLCFRVWLILGESGTSTKLELHEAGARECENVRVWFSACVRPPNHINVKYELQGLTVKT